MLALMLYVPFNIFSNTTSVFLLSSLVDPVLSRLYKSVLLKESTQCPDESRTSDPRSPLSKWKIKKILIKCRTDWKNYRHTRSGYIPRSSRPYCGIFFLSYANILKIKRIKDTTPKVHGERTKAHWDKSPLGQKPTGQYPTGQKPTA